MFRGKATDQELASIRQWVNADQANRKAFFRERTFYDALQLSKKATANKPSARKTFIWSWSQTVAAAAVILICVLAGPALWSHFATDEMVFNTIKVPTGQRVEMTLSDGTHIWLNARSELTYPTSFNGKKREVWLKGEAFFNVTKQGNKKFIVNTGRCEVEVLGTQFNVESYEDDEFSTALMQGSVKVTDSENPDQVVTLTPNNSATLCDGQLKVSPISNFDAYSWKEGIITFRNTSFKDLMRKMEKNYGIRIIINNPKRDHYSCSGKFRISDTIEAVLKALQQDAKFSFEYKNNDTIIIQ